MTSDPGGSPDDVCRLNSGSQSTSASGPGQMAMGGSMEVHEDRGGVCTVRNIFARLESCSSY